jgi:hypothetical protein
MSNTGVVTSTINVPTFLETICENAVVHGSKDFSVYVINDVKSPNEAKPYCAKLARKYGIKIQCFDIEDQRKALKNYRTLLDIIPLNNNARKMIGTFLSYLDGCDRVIMIDDDNFATRHDFIGFHNIVGMRHEIDLVKSDAGWFNVCETMIEKNRVPFYPRGYPWSKRFINSKNSMIRKKARVIVNAGLVLGDPDVDAVSRLFWPIDVVAIDSEYDPIFALNPETWCPFNDQNTAISREIIPLYFKPPAVLRNADIWTSYLIEKIAERMGDVVAFGQPLVVQYRNQHDLREDYALEELHNRATDTFVNLLRKTSLNRKSYLGCMEELINKCLENIKSGALVDEAKTSDSRHAHMPNKSKMREKKLEEAYLIEKFFVEYKIWHQVITDLI